MRHWSQLAIRNWRAKPGRTLAGTMAIALGVGVVVWVTCCYESVRRSVMDQVWAWLGKSHVNIESPLGHWGVIDQNLLAEVSTLPNVKAATARLKQRLTALRVQPGREPTTDQTSSDKLVEIDLLGIDPAREYEFRTYELVGANSRLLRPDDTDAALVELSLAEALGVGLGDSIWIRGKWSLRPYRLRVVGLYRQRRVAKFQKPRAIATLPQAQQIAEQPGKVTVIDLILKDPSLAGLNRTAVAVNRIVRKHNKNYVVGTAEAKLRQLRAAQKQTEFILMLIASVALFTAFFVILSTLSMGMLERVGQLGLLRCLALTRRQVSLLVLTEVVPLTVLGLAVGVPIGLGLTWLSAWLVPEYIGAPAISIWGIQLALVGGAITALGGGIIPAIQATRVSPLEATRAQSRPGRIWVDVVAAAIGVAMVIAHTIMVERLQTRQWFLHSVTLVGVSLLYCGYALLAPALVRFVGNGAALLAAASLRLRGQLLRDQVGRAVWRSSGICCGLMVGLSLIVSVVVHAESLKAGWNFPKDLAEAFVWTRKPIPMELVEKVRRLPGVKRLTVVNDITCSIDRHGPSWLRVDMNSFAAGDPDTFFQMARIEFLEGDPDEAIAKLKRGGYVLVPVEFARTRHKKVGDKLRIRVGQRSATFEIAGVVESPALEIAASFFQAETNLMFASTLAVLGTLADAKRCFKVDEVSLLLLDFDLPPEPVPPDFGERDFAELRKFLAGSLIHVDPAKMSLEQRWRWYRQQKVLQQIVKTIGRPDAQVGSVQQLKDAIDADIDRATLLFTAVPAVALLIAALGVGNLMMANVTSRSRQIAVLRAIGATKWQVSRLVIGEAMVLGVLGCALGLALGIHGAYNVNYMTFRMWGLDVGLIIPWGFVILGIGFTLGVCLLAGILPARYASRDNIIEAMQTA